MTVLLCPTTPQYADRKIYIKRPDNVIKDFKENKCYFIDIIIASDKKHFRIIKLMVFLNKDFEREIAKMRYKYSHYSSSGLRTRNYLEG